jgi:putative transposase
MPNSSLFIKSFHHLQVEDFSYFRTLIVYIHRNPVKHGFAKCILDYPWSSYHAIVSDKITKPKRDDVLNCFNDIENFKFMHHAGDVDEERMKDYLVE